MKPIPAKLIFLGIATEIEIVPAPRNSHPWKKDWKSETYNLFNSSRTAKGILADGWIMATTPKAFQAQNPSLYLIRATKIVIDYDNPALDHKSNEEAFFAWTSRKPESVILIDTPPPASEYYGAITGICYLSDKWKKPNAKPTLYHHDFFENNGDPPSIYFDGKFPENSKIAEISGGTMRISSRGII